MVPYVLSVRRGMDLRLSRCPPALTEVGSRWLWAMGDKPQSRSLAPPPRSPLISAAGPSGPTAGQVRKP